MGTTQNHEEHAMPPVQTAPEHHKESRGIGKKILKLLLILILLAAAAAAGWYYRDMDAKEDAKVASAEIAALKDKNSKLEQDLAAAKAANTAARTPSAETLDDIKAAVQSGNYAALESLMEDKVTVIVAASDGVGERTPAQAVADLAYLDDGTDPWDFALTAAILDGFRDGDYAKYFPQTALVGKSANNYVVSFSFDNDGEKINTIFMSNTDESL